jgi:hypothetical protein
MAAKRMAGQQLNHENWDDAEESEEAGQFKQVPLALFYRSAQAYFACV